MNEDKHREGLVSDERIDEITKEIDIENLDDDEVAEAREAAWTFAHAKAHAEAHDRAENAAGCG